MPLHTVCCVRLYSLQPCMICQVLLLSGKLLRVNTGDREVLYFEAPRGKQHFINKDEDEEIEWATRTGVLGQAYEGIWPPYSDVTDVNAAMVCPSGNVIATGDDFGYVKLFTFPSLVSGRSPAKCMVHYQAYTICLPISRYACLSTYLSVCLSVCLSVSTPGQACEG